MNNILLAASLLALTMGAAQAGEGNGDPFPNTASHSLVANQVLSDTGSESSPTYGLGVTVVTQGDILPTVGSESVVQTANSLPTGFEDGTVAYAQAQSMQRWAQAHQAVPVTQLAMRLTRQALNPHWLEQVRSSQRRYPPLGPHTCRRRIEQMAGKAPSARKYGLIRSTRQPVDDEAK